MRCADEFKIFTNINSTIVDPKDFDAKQLRRLQRRRLHHPAELVRAGAHGRVLPHPAQRADDLPRQVTYARCGIIVNVTPLEPEWEGHVTLEFSNTTPLPAKIYANEGVAQMLFLESDEVCETSYKDRGGKYQGQTRRHAAEGVEPPALCSNFGQDHHGLDLALADLLGAHRQDIPSSAPARSATGGSEPSRVLS